ncbi:12090_t:CDS:1, partial [Racocetra persica]
MAKCKHSEKIKELEIENALLRYNLDKIKDFTNVNSLGIKHIDYKKGKVIIDTNKTLYCWKCSKEINAGQICYECAGIDPEKGISAEAISSTMDGLREVQEKHAEQMKKAEKKKEPIILMDEYEKKDTPKEQPNSFKEFAESMNKVECVECKEKIALSSCDYDPARNKYTCHQCQKKLKEIEEQNKEAETQKKIKELGNKYG